MVKSIGLKIWLRDLDTFDVAIGESFMFLHLVTKAYTSCLIFQTLSFFIMSFSLPACIFNDFPTPSECST